MDSFLKFKNVRTTIQKLEHLYDHSSNDKEIVGRGAGERPAVEKMC